MTLNVPLLPSGATGLEFAIRLYVGSGLRASSCPEHQRGRSGLCSSSNTCAPAVLCRRALLLLVQALKATMT